ncbi:MAG: histidine phosphatase family protein [Acidobacteriota bacterium]|nr:histidine phosphatase family protein [Acidobacteriota bacterium]
MRDCVLIRHGETSMAGLFCGHSDPPLNDAGRQQIGLVGAMLGQRPDVIYASDLRRARQSAELIASHFGLAVHVRPGLREIDFGAWEGLYWTQIEEQFPAEARAWMERYPEGKIPAGERYETFRERVRLEMRFLLAEAEIQSLVAVTHGGFIRTALTELYSLPHAEAHRWSAQYASIVSIPFAQAGGTA